MKATNKDFPLNSLQFSIALDTVKMMTECNNVPESYIMGTELLIKMGLPAELLLSKFKLIAELHSLDGHLTPELNAYRYSVYNNMMALAKGGLSRYDFDNFYQSF